MAQIILNVIPLLLGIFNITKTVIAGTDWNIFVVRVGVYLDFLIRW